jgi:hypothetical protein
MPSQDWPEWWDWDLEITPHVEQRMEEREFTEVDLREMLQHAAGFRADHVEGRFILDVNHRNRPWHVIVEPDEEERLLVVVTAYCLG